MHPALIEFAAKMAARCKTELPIGVEWAVTMTSANDLRGHPRIVRVTLRFEGRKASGEITEGLAANDSGRIDYHVDRMWTDFMRYLRPPVPR